MKTNIILILLFLFIFCSDAISVPADVEDISGRDYTGAAINAIDNAKESIYMVMYLISFNKENKESPVYRLLYALKKARERGIGIKIILDYRSSEDEKEGSVSYYAYRFLKDSGINVIFDTPSVYTHNKTLVIDGKIIITGSANWSEAALTKNNENNFIFESPELAQSLINRFNQIELIPEGNEQNGAQSVLIPLKSMDSFREMARNNDERAFDIYLLFLKTFTGDDILDITYENIRDSIGMNREDYRNMLNRTLKKLSNNYKLIELKLEYNKQPIIKLIFPPPLISSSFKIPEDCWKYGWNRRLNIAEKFCLLINLREVSSQAKWNEWMLTKEQMSAKYGLNRHTLAKGMLGLRKYNIIDIEYSEIDKGYLNRMPSLTRFLGLYNFDEFSKKINGLEEKYGKEITGEARDYAAIVYKSYDAEAVENIIKFINIYGRKKVKNAFLKVKIKAIDNPKRSFKYVIGILKSSVGIRN